MLSSPIDLLDAGFAWTGDRIAAVTPDQLGAPTPCTEFDLAQLLDHLMGGLRRFADAVDPAPQPWIPTGDHTGAFAVVRERAMAAWRAADIGATYRIPLGDLPGAVVANVNLTEVVVHGWDVGRATGEDADIPDDLAVPILAFCTELIDQATRLRAFAPARAGGTTASDRLVGFLGRTP
jgi:uncharacterized protein (TIGR03086 family)